MTAGERKELVELSEKYFKDYPDETNPSTQAMVLGNRKLLEIFREAKGRRIIISTSDNLNVQGGYESVNFI